MIRLFNFTSLILALVIVGVLLISIGCSTTNHEGFAIYLTREDISPGRIEALSHVDIADQPIISIDDVITYNAQTHELKLTDQAFERICQLDVPVQGKSFLVCVDKGPIYWGAFWTPVSSISFDGVTIWIPFGPLGSQEQKIITLELGYPSSSFYDGEDPRNNTEVIKSLERENKLINELSITDVDMLPRSFKGYELYSWQEDGEWYFTLITGTNRNKTLDEIISKGNYISETGWVKAQVAGIDAINDVLDRIPENESIFWCGGMRLGQTAEMNNYMQLPPQEITDAIMEHAKRCGLDLVIIVR